MKGVWNSPVIENARSRMIAVVLKGLTAFVLGVVALSFSRSPKESGQGWALSLTVPAGKEDMVYRGCRVCPQKTWHTAEGARAPGAQGGAPRSVLESWEGSLGRSNIESEI